eukprot:jgi/Astpho2/5439/e_gw1.00076.31.1_t
MHSYGNLHYKAFYSSEIGGIVTEPPLMVLPIDDHMAHRGHAIFDTAIIAHGALYLLDRHLDRFLHSAYRAGLALPYSLDQLARIIIETAAIGGAFTGYVRYWLSAGRGGFGLSPKECMAPAFYCVVYTKDEAFPDPTQGISVKTSPVPINPIFYTNIKSVNYLPNVLCQMDAEDAGYDQGVFLDSEGYVAEGPTANIGIITHDNEMVVPPEDTTLRGVTMERLIEVVPQYMGTIDMPSIDRISRRKFTVEEAKAAREVFMAGSSMPVRGVTRWDGDQIYTGDVGRTTMALHRAIEEDMDPSNKDPKAGYGEHVMVPFGFSTGMLPKREPIPD